MSEIVARTEAEVVQDLKDLRGKEFISYREKWDKVNNFELETDFPMITFHILIVFANTCFLGIANATLFCPLPVFYRYVICRDIATK